MAGTFYARESVSVLYNFVREALREDWLPFELLGPGGLKLTDENLAFNECGLVSDKNDCWYLPEHLEAVRVFCCSELGEKFVSFQSPKLCSGPSF